MQRNRCVFLSLPVGTPHSSMGFGSCDGLYMVYLVCDIWNEESVWWIWYVCNMWGVYDVCGVYCVCGICVVCGLYTMCM